MITSKKIPVYDPAMIRALLTRAIDEKLEVRWYTRNSAFDSGLGVPHWLQSQGKIWGVRLVNEQTKESSWGCLRDTESHADACTNGNSDILDRGIVKIVVHAPEAQEAQEAQEAPETCDCEIDLSSDTLGAKRIAEKGVTSEPSICKTCKGSGTVLDFDAEWEPYGALCRSCLDAPAPEWEIIKGPYHFNRQTTVRYNSGVIVEHIAFAQFGRGAERLLVRTAFGSRAETRIEICRGTEPNEQLPQLTIVGECCHEMIVARMLVALRSGEVKG